jgi:hypothetical protein
MYSMRVLCRAVVVSSFFSASMISPTQPAQVKSHVFTVAAAKQNAAHVGVGTVLVHGHFWCGKEGSIIFDTGYKAVLKLRFSDHFNSKHSFRELLDNARKSDVATIEGQLQVEPNGRVILIADDIRFAVDSR